MIALVRVKFLRIHILPMNDYYIERLLRGSLVSSRMVVVFIPDHHDHHRIRGCCHHYLVHYEHRCSIIINTIITIYHFGTHVHDDPFFEADQWPGPQLNLNLKLQAIQKLSTEERIRIQIIKLYFIFCNHPRKSTKMRHLNKCSDKCSVKSRHVTSNPNDQRVSNMR